MRDLGQRHLVGAVERGCRRSGPIAPAARPLGLRMLEEGHGAPGALVREAEMADLSGLHEVVDDRRASPRSGVRIGVLVRGRSVGLEPQGIGAVGPMDLVEVDIVGLQPLQALVRPPPRSARGRARLGSRRRGTRCLSERPTTLEARITLSRLPRALNQEPMIRSVEPLRLGLAAGSSRARRCRRN